MATTIGLGVQFTANANGMTKGLSDADRAIKNLAQQASSAARLFDTFASSSAAAAQTQQQVATDVAFLGSAFRTGQISAEQYAAELRGIVASANGAAQAFAEGAQVTERVATAEEKRAATLGRLAQLLEQGAISQQTYERAAADASGANAEAAKAESARAQALARAAQITQANLSPAQKYDQEVQELNQHLQAGRISQETYNTALQKAAQQFAKAEVAAAQYDAAADNAGTGNVLAFNELSGILSAIPGPLGNVAGRISGLSSAAEGLGRVFAGGVSQGFGALATSAAGLVNPMTLAVGGIAAFGAGAVAVASGLSSLEDRVEQLGNLADQLGVSFEFIQVLEESAKRSGVSVDSLAGAMTRLQKTLAGADEESKSAQAALARLGVGIEELNGLSQEDQIRLIGERIAAIEDPAQRTAAALALFGKSGAALLPFFKNLGPAAADIERFGGALSAIDRRRLDEFGEGLDALSVASSRAGDLLVLPFAGLGEGISKGTAEFLGGINAILKPIGDVLEPAFTGLGVAFEAFGTIVGGIGRVIGALLQPFGQLAQAIGSVTTPLFEMGESLIQSFVDGTVAVAEFIASFSPLEAITASLNAVGEAVGRVATIIGTAFSKVGEYVGGLVSRFGELVAQSPLLQAIGNTISNVFGSVSSVFGTIANAIGGTVGRLLTIAENFLGIERSVGEAKATAEDFASVEPPEGFVDFEKSIGRSRETLNKAIEESSQFGQAGFDAALQFQTALQKLQAQAEAGILNENAYEQEVDKATEAYRNQIDTIKEAAAEEERKAEAARRSAEAAIEADQRRADAAVERLRVEQEFGGDSQRAEAAKNVLAIENEIARAEAELRNARDAGDQDAANAAAARLAQLDQVAARERDIASGVAQQREEADKKAKQAIEERKRAEEQKAKQVAALEEQYAERLADIEADRLDALSRQSNEALTGNDLRTSAGAAQFIALATGREDPAVEEYRKQLRELQDIRREIAKANAAPVEIAG